MPDLARLMADLSPQQRELLLLKLNKHHRDRGSTTRTPIARQIRRSAAGGEPDCFPVSAAQESLWFLDRLQPGAASYHISEAIRLNGALDVPVLERCLSEIVRRHEV